VITELRPYRIKSERLDSWLAFFAEAARENERHGSRVEYAGVDVETSTFVWLRTFADEADREARKDAFYGSTGGWSARHSRWTMSSNTMSSSWMRPFIETAAC
jgi:hypothetical protein